MEETLSPDRNPDSEVLPEISGTYETAVRIFAKNPDLPHRQDFELVKWL